MRGALGERRWRTDIGFLKSLFAQSARGFQRDNSPQMAAAISYYVLLSLFPALIFIVGVAGLFIQGSSAQQHIVNAVLDNIPLSEGEGRNTVRDAVNGVTGGGSGVLGVLGLLGMAWSASAMFGVIRVSLNRAYGVERKRPFVQQKLVDLAMVAGLGAFFAISIAATAFLRVARTHSQELASLGDVARGTGLLWDVASYLIPLGFSFLAFVALYTVVPTGRRRPGDVWPGALTAAVLFDVGKFGFSIYLEHFSTYNLVFGSLGAAASFLFFVYMSANIMLFGAEVASAYPLARRGELAMGEGGEGERRPLRERAWRALRGLFVEDGPRKA